MDAHDATPATGADERDYRRVINAWAMYDWANSAFAVIILTAVYPVYYRALVTTAGYSPEDATAFWAYTTSGSVFIVALLGPLLGAIADVAGKKRFLGGSIALGVLGTAGLAFLGSDTFLMGSLLFAVGNFGFAAGNIFYEALLPHIARRDDVDRVSARGYAFGYLGGGVLLIVTALWLVAPHSFWMADRDFALRASFVSVAVWWAVFSWPLFRSVAEPGGTASERISLALVADGWRRLVHTLRRVKHYKELAIFLLAFWIYNDGISTIIKIATAYGDEIGIGHNDMLIALVATQLVGFPSTLAFGALAGRMGAKGAIFLGLGIYMLISLAGFFMRSALHFYILATMVGLVQGGTQALSRSLFSRLVPKARSTEFFGFFSTGEKFAGVIGPAIFGAVGQLTGSSRWGITSVTCLFAAGAALLWRVDVKKGEAVAQSVKD
jgi:UMF1 family MFS transporter